MTIVEIAKKIKQAGGILYLVGGALRDKLRGVIPVDEDYCVTGFTVEKFQNLFPEAKIQGKDFPVFILEGKEIALARKERKVGQGHKAFSFSTDETITIQEDLIRRDITINSIAQDVLTKEIIDPYGGRKDLEQKVIRKTSSHFAEDPLRAYRVARLAANLEEFMVESGTLFSMEQLKEELRTLSKERVFVEFKKALASSKPSIFFEVLRQSNILQIHFQEIADLIGKIQPEKYHPEGDSYRHTLIVVDNSAKTTNDLAIRFSCLAHDLGKGLTPKEILPHHYGHDEKGVELVAKLGKKIGIPKTWEKCGKTACKWHMKAGIFEQMTPKKQVELIENVAKSMLGLEGLQIVVACDKSREGKDILEKQKEITFANLGKELLQNVNGDVIKQKYPELTGEKFKQKLREERIKWLQDFYKIYNKV